MECNAKYHIERYLDKKEIHMDIFEYKYEDVWDLVQLCQEKDREAGRRALRSPRRNTTTPGESLRRDNSRLSTPPTALGSGFRPSEAVGQMPATPAHTFIEPSSSYSGSTTYSISGTGSSSSRLENADYSPSPPPRRQTLLSPQGTSTSKSRTGAVEEELRSGIFTPGISDIRPTEGDTSDFKSWAQFG
jgi:hypothetical protein